jgi:putative hemolysin
MRRAAAAAAALATAAVVPDPALAIANPASVFCVESGGKSVILRDVGGNEFGVCILPGGEMVEEWAYYRAHRPVPMR